MTTLPKTYKAAIFERPNASLVIKDIPLKAPSIGEILVKIIASGVCHSDAAVQTGAFGNSFPIVTDTVAAVGNGEKKWTVGNRFQMCQNATINGVTKDGEYAKYVLLRSEAAVKVPLNVDPVEYAPILCAGVTVFNSIRKLHILPGDLVAVQSLEGLGHLAVQYANKMGYRVVALSSGKKKREFAQVLRAHNYINTSKLDATEKLKELSSASLIVCTAPNPTAIGPLTGGLEPGSKLLVLAPCGTVEINTLDLISHAASVSGYPSGHALNSEEAIAFTKLHNIRCIVEKFPLRDAQKAFDHMLSSDVKFKSVIVMD